MSTYRRISELKNIFMFFTVSPKFLFVNIIRNVFEIGENTVNSRCNEPREEIEKSSLYREFVMSKIFKIQNFVFKHTVFE